MKKEKITGPLWIRTENTEAENYLVGVPLNNLFTIFFMSSSGEFLNPANPQIWHDFKRSAEGTEREVSQVPNNLFDDVMDHAIKSQIAIKNKWDVKIFVLTGEMMPPKQKDHTEKTVSMLEKNTTTESETRTTFSMSEVPGFQKLLEKTA
ncbi:MAG: hypothetical protein WCO58_03080 [bacterium]